MATITAPDTRQRTVRWADPAKAGEQSREMSGRAWLEGVRDGTVPAPPAAVLLGMEVERVDDDEIVFSLEPAEFLYNPAGTVHGGFLATLADTVMTTAVIAALPAGAWAPTIEIKINFIRPVSVATGRIFGAGRVIHLGGSTAVSEARIVDGNGRLLAHATSTAAIHRRQS